MENKEDMMRRYTYDDMSVMAEKLLPYIKTDRYQLFIRDPDDKDANYWIPENLPDFRFIVNRMLEGIGSRAMEDLIDLLRAYAVRDSSYQLNTDAHYTLFKNGIFDITSGDSITKPDAMFSYRCPHNLNMEATSNGAVDNFLELVSRGDKTIESAILAMGGAAITGYNPAGRIFFLLDDGFGGSTIIEKLLLTILGEEFVSTLMLVQFGQRFYPAAIRGKKVNLGAIGCAEIPTTTKEIIKMIAKGALPVTIEQKGVPVRGEAVAPTLIFHGTEIPSIQGRDSWFSTKTVIIPLRSDFLMGKDDVENQYIRELSTENSVQYLIQRMLKEIHHVYITGEFPVPHQSEDELIRLSLRQNPLSEYVRQTEKSVSDFERKPLSEVANEINSFHCKHGVDPLEVKIISTGLKKIFPSLGVKTMRHKGNPCKCFYQTGGDELVRS